MSHVDDGTLHALVDDQLEPRERATVEAHLAACGECARRFAEAMAMARQVTTLLGALDEMPVRVTVAPPAPHVEATTSDVARATEVTPIRSRLLTMRRVAIAASVLLVASVSYEVGRRGDAPVATAPAAITADAATEAMSATPSTPSTPAAQVTADTARLGSAAPLATTTPQAAMRAQESRGDFAGAGAAADRAIAASVASVAATPAAQQLAQNAVVVPAPSGAPASMKVDAAIDQRTVGSQVAAVAAPVEQAARRETLLERAARNPPQLNAVVVTGAPAAPPSQQAPPSSADVPGRDVDGRSPQIPGYTMTQSESVPSVTVRRYVPSAGPPVTLLIVQAPRKPGARGAAGDGQPELTLSTVEGQSIVRWHAQDRDYELRGALAPDSLVKLATLLR